MEKPFYTVSDIAPRLGVTTARVYQMISKGEIPSVRIGGAIRIPVAAWQEWVQSENAHALKAVRGYRYQLKP